MYLPYDEFIEQYSVSKPSFYIGRSQVYKTENNKCLKVYSNYSPENDVFVPESFFSGLRELAFSQFLDHRCVLPLEAWSYRTSITKTGGFVLYLVFPWCDEVNVLDDADILEIIDFLDYLHSQGISHNDLKSSAILRYKDQLKVTGLGLTRSCLNVVSGNYNSGLRYTPGYRYPKIHPNNYTRSEDTETFALGKIISQSVSGLHAASLKHIYPQDIAEKVNQEDQKWLLACKLCDDDVEEKMKYSNARRFDIIEYPAIHPLENLDFFHEIKEFPIPVILQIIYLIRCIPGKSFNSYLAIVTQLSSWDIPTDYPINYQHIIEIAIFLDGNLYFPSMFELVTSHLQAIYLIQEALYGTTQGVPRNAQHDEPKKLFLEETDYERCLLTEFYQVCGLTPYPFMIPSELNGILPLEYPLTDYTWAVNELDDPAKLKAFAPYIYNLIYYLINYHVEAKDYIKFMKFAKNNFIGKYTLGKINVDITNEDY